MNIYKINYYYEIKIIECKNACLNDNNMISFSLLVRSTMHLCNVSVRVTIVTNTNGNIDSSPSTRKPSLQRQPLKLVSASARVRLAGHYIQLQFSACFRDNNLARPKNVFPRGCKVLLLIHIYKFLIKPIIIIYCINLEVLVY